jgi:hypothetical protein
MRIKKTDTEEFFVGPEQFHNAAGFGIAPERGDLVAENPQMPSGNAVFFVFL